MKRLRLLINKSLILLAASVPTHALAFEYVPYAGFEGYQEIQISADIFYVAAHGDRKSAISDVEAAWKTRAAALCRQQNHGYFTALKYSFEPVLKLDMAASTHDHMTRGEYLKVGGGFVYIPIYVPGPNPNARLSAPSKQSHIRCFSTLSEAIDPGRAISVEEVLDEGRQRGWIK